MHERIIIPESVFSVVEDGSEYVAAVREMDLDEIIGRASLMMDFMYSLAFDNNSALAERTLRPFLAIFLAMSYRSGRRAAISGLETGE